MPEYSYNGWLASRHPVDFGGLANLVVHGESFAPGVRAGDVHTIFNWLAHQLHARVEPVYRAGWHAQDDWGYNYRLNRNANNLSCHSSGTAIDYNATRHPNGTRGTFNAAQVAEIRHIVQVELEDVVSWGGDWGPGSTPDWMHFEIQGSAAKVARVADRLRRGKPAPGGTVDNGGIQWEDEPWDGPLGERVLDLGSIGTDVAFVQRWHGITDDGEYGNQTAEHVKRTQARNGVEVDGVVGPVTWALMGVGEEPARPFPLPEGHYYGDINGPAESHGGYYDHEKPVVQDIQEELIRQGLVGHVGTNPDATTWDDGIFGPPTVEAVKAFQRRVGLAVDGKVGPKTWAALFGG